MPTTTHPLLSMAATTQAPWTGPPRQGDPSNGGAHQCPALVSGVPFPDVIFSLSKAHTQHHHGPVAQTVLFLMVMGFPQHLQVVILKASTICILWYITLEHLVLLSYTQICPCLNMIIRLWNRRNNIVFSSRCKHVHA
ncbi:hypothetical protein ZWY2020_022087 [Hordeum vulgare]|nr:hypothetical protein ZWY2020_022087 [Hordeum vulgare]